MKDAIETVQELIEFLKETEPTTPVRYNCGTGEGKFKRQDFIIDARDRLVIELDT